MTQRRQRAHRLAVLLLVVTDGAHDLGVLVGTQPEALQHALAEEGRGVAVVQTVHPVANVVQVLARDARELGQTRRMAQPEKDALGDAGDDAAVARPVLCVAEHAQTLVRLAHEHLNLVIATHVAERHQAVCACSSCRSSASPRSRGDSSAGASPDGEPRDPRRRRDLAAPVEHGTDSFAISEGAARPSRRSGCAPGHASREALLTAACGLMVPMMSGRGLGHTGGTLDKLEAIPGFKVQLSVPEFRAILQKVGAAMIGQTPRVVPADRKLYALRDVTGTVECIPLICASIMSKKLAEGIDSLVLDVKFGRGAFMKSKEHAHELAQAMVETGRAAGKPVRALLTAMNQPLGRAAGHTTEVIESIECLKGRGPADLMEVTFALTGHMLILGGVAIDMTEAQAKMSAAIADGSALKKFRDMCTAQGGDTRVVDYYNLLPTAKTLIAVKAPAEAKGFVSAVDALKCGHAIMALGGGRAAVTDRIDHAVGLADLIKIGEPVAPGTLLCTLHASDDAKAARAETLIREAVKFGPAPPQLEPLIQDLIQ